MRAILQRVDAAAQTVATTSTPAPLRVLIVHNAYQQRGGEDAVVDAERDLLRAHGHPVEIFQRHNDELRDERGDGLRGIALAQAAVDTIWSRQSVVTLQSIIARFKPDVVHFHNTFPLISPAAYRAVRAAGLPVVQTLHNFRLHCPQAMYLRDGKVCENCLGKLPWRSVLHACYRDSRVQSAVLSGMLVVHRTLGTYRDHVTRYIALNSFCRDKFIQGGLPPERVVIKPNFVDFAAPPLRARGGFLFVGRLSAEKGIRVLMDAWRLADAGLNGAILRVAGTGAEAFRLDDVVRLHALGALDGAAVREQMACASVLVLPSICYDSFPRTLVEAFASGLPVIASRLGPLADLVQEGVTGLLFAPGDAADLANKLRWACAHPAELAEMGLRARAKYEAEFCAERNYPQLMAIYADAIQAITTEQR